jgi:hypothetical protein
MSKVTRDGITRTSGDGGEGTTRADSDWVPDGGEGNTPPPRKHLDLNATITLSEDALAELLAEVKKGRGAPDLEQSITPANLPDPPDRTSEKTSDRLNVRPLPERAPAHPVVPQLWRRAEGASKRKF